MATAKVTRRIQIGTNTPIEQVVDMTGSGVIDVQESVGDGQTDLQINVAIDVSALQAIQISSDQDVTIETNNGTTPDDTFTLKANKPITWVANDVAANPFASGVDVTAVFVTNSSGSTANVKILGVQDATP